MTATLIGAFAHSLLRPGNNAVAVFADDVVDCECSGLERDEMNLNRLLVPFAPAEAGTQTWQRLSA